MTTMQAVSRFESPRSAHPSFSPLRRFGRAAAALVLVVGAALAAQQPAQAGGRGDRVAGALFGAGVGALVGQSIGGRDGAAVGSIIGAGVGLSAVQHGHRNHYDRRGTRGYRHTAPRRYYQERPRYRHGSHYRARHGHPRFSHPRHVQRGYRAPRRGQWVFVPGR